MTFCRWLITLALPSSSLGGWLLVIVINYHPHRFVWKENPHNIIYLIYCARYNGELFIHFYILRWPDVCNWVFCWTSIEWIANVNTWHNIFSLWFIPSTVVSFQLLNKLCLKTFRSGYLPVTFVYSFEFTGAVIKFNLPCLFVFWILFI